MKPRNFLSALFARFARFFARKQHLVRIDSCRARKRQLTARQREIVELLARGVNTEPLVSL